MARLFVVVTLILSAVAVQAQVRTLPPPTPYIYISYPNALAKVDPATDAILANIPVGLSPAGIAVNSDVTRIYVANNLSNDLSVVSGITDMVIATIPVGLGPDRVVLLPNETKLYVANVNGGSVTVIDTSTNAVVREIPISGTPTGLVGTASGDRVAVSNFDLNAVQIIDTTSDEIVATFPVTSPLGIAFNENSNQFDVASSDMGIVAVFDGATYLPVGSVSVPSPKEVSIKWDGTIGYATSSTTPSVFAFNPADNTLRGQAAFDPPASSAGMCFNPSGSMLYAASGSTVFRMDTTTNRFNDAFQNGGANPYLIAGRVRWGCGDYQKVSGGPDPPIGTVWRICKYEFRNACPATTTLDDGSTWQFTGNCKDNDQ